MTIRSEETIKKVSNSVIPEYSPICNSISFGWLSNERKIQLIQNEEVHSLGPFSYENKKKLKSHFLDSEIIRVRTSISYFYFEVGKSELSFIVGSSKPDNHFGISLSDIKY